MSLSHTAALPAFHTVADPSSVGPRWIKWLQRLENYSTAVNSTRDPRLKALLLHLAGPRGCQGEAENVLHAKEKWRVSGVYVQKSSATAPDFAC